MLRFATWFVIGAVALAGFGMLASGCSNTSKTQRGYRIGDPNMPAPPPDGGERRSTDDTAQ